MIIPEITHRDESLAKASPVIGKPGPLQPQAFMVHVHGSVHLLLWFPASERKTAERLRVRETGQSTQSSAFPADDAARKKACSIELGHATSQLIRCW